MHLLNVQLPLGGVNVKLFIKPESVEAYYRDENGVNEILKGFEDDEELEIEEEKPEDSDEDIEVEPAKPSRTERPVPSPTATATPEKLKIEGSVTSVQNILIVVNGIAKVYGMTGYRIGWAVAPREIAFAEQLPRTRSGKIMRRLLRARELGLPEGDLSTLEGAA